MYGAILGDMIGAPYEFDRGNKTKDFPLFCDKSNFTDDTVMTVAVAEVLLDYVYDEFDSDEELKQALIASMQNWGSDYPNAGYGAMFSRWLEADNPQPYNSFGNGSAMRVLAAGWLATSLEEAMKLARLTAEVTHNHPEGIKGAQAVAGSIYLALDGKDKVEIKSFVTDVIGYDLSRTCDEIRPNYHHDETCQRSVPEAITAFLEGEDFEDVIRTTISLGGDTDTLACIAGSIAEAYYGIPDELVAECRNNLPEEMITIVNRFYEVVDEMWILYRGKGKKLSEEELSDGALLREAIRKYKYWNTDDSFWNLLAVLRDSNVWIPCNAISGSKDQTSLNKIIQMAGDNLDSLVGMEFTNEEPVRLVPVIISNGEDDFIPVFSSVEVMGEYENQYSKVAKHFLEILEIAQFYKNRIFGIVLNPFTEPVILHLEMAEIVEKIRSRVGR
ncbi:ADP-ribosylglycohydrolase family protein [Anaerovibrio sp. RM50]|uniref:ADP-ribosylglycohydrolase family protein n=1 Tax=Anaerovibrio sp. RM50 TaxID=1200557 RepID=UPI000907810A|nr:ADP-ribosylglycohydrolase family protein [Anaerovibrio sp. RM50]